LIDVSVNPESKEPCHVNSDSEKEKCSLAPFDETSRTSEDVTTMSASLNQTAPPSNPREPETFDELVDHLFSVVSNSSLVYGIVGMIVTCDGDLDVAKFMCEKRGYPPDTIAEIIDAFKKTYRTERRVAIRLGK
jgi:hypothetical protein